MTNRSVEEPLEARRAVPAAGRSPGAAGEIAKRRVLPGSSTPENSATEW